MVFTSPPEPAGRRSRRTNGGRSTPRFARKLTQADWRNDDNAVLVLESFSLN